MRASVGRALYLTPPTIRTRPTPRDLPAAMLAGNDRNVGDPLAHIGYATQSPIAAGAFSQVVRAKHMASGREVAIKTFMTRQKGGKPAADLDDMRAGICAILSRFAYRRPLRWMPKHARAATHRPSVACG